MDKENNLYNTMFWVDVQTFEPLIEHISHSVYVAGCPLFQNRSVHSKSFSVGCPSFNAIVTVNIEREQNS